MRARFAARTGGTCPCVPPPSGEVVGRVGQLFFFATLPSRRPARMPLSPTPPPLLRPLCTRRLCRGAVCSSAPSSRSSAQGGWRGCSAMRERGAVSPRKGRTLPHARRPRAARATPMAACMHALRGAPCVCSRRASSSYAPPLMFAPLPSSWRARACGHPSHEAVDDERLQACACQVARWSSSSKPAFVVQVLLPQSSVLPRLFCRRSLPSFRALWNPTPLGSSTAATARPPTE